MGFLSNLAATYSTYSTYPSSRYYTSSPVADETAGIVAAVAIIIGLIIAIGAYVLVSIFIMKLFKKAGVKPWIAWVPVYNQWKFLQIGGYPGGLVFLAVGGVILYIIGMVLMFIGSLGAKQLMVFAILGVLFMCLTFVACVIATVFQCMAAYQIGKKLGKEGAWVVLYIFCSTIWMGICGLDSSKWDDSKGKKRRDVVAKK
ncbi:MAG: DUF5684 domain-containing protein [Candidatus Nomurabacteria bacterium]|jgi:hypothetical protein|nr:DUF5684 domain-containing protein [Candidatus Nomurabacteria bacterium]